WHHDAAVGLLVLLEDRDDRAADGERRPVQRVREPGLGLRLGPIPDLRAARLEVAEVRAARNLAVAVLPGPPDPGVVTLPRAEARVAGAEQRDAVVQAEQLQDLLRVAREQLVLRVRRLGRREAHELHLVELVLADEAAHVLSVAASLAPEARRVRRVRDRQRA